MRCLLKNSMFVWACIPVCWFLHPSRRQPLSSPATIRMHESWRRACAEYPS